MRRASRALTRLYDGALAAAGLTVTQFTILRTLARIGAASVTDLAQATGHERSAMTRALRPLHAAGLVAIGAGADQRSRGLSITDDGRAAVGRAEPGWRAAQAAIDLRLDPVEREQLFALLGKVEQLDTATAR